MLLRNSDIRGLAWDLYGCQICKHCVRMLCHAIEGRGEYIVSRCGRCGLEVDSRKINEFRRANILDYARSSLINRKNWQILKDKA